MIDSQNQSAGRSKHLIQVRYWNLHFVLDSFSWWLSVNMFNYATGWIGWKFEVWLQARWLSRLGFPWIKWLGLWLHPWMWCQSITGNPQHLSLVDLTILWYPCVPLGGKRHWENTCKVTCTRTQHRDPSLLKPRWLDLETNNELLNY